MPWKETKVVTERMKFVLAVEAEPLESMTVLCARFGISRKTGYKWLKRFEGEGPGGLEDRASLARSISHRLPANVVLQVLELRKEHPFWGPKKLRARVTMEEGKTAPAASTIGAVLKAYGLVRPRRRRPLKTGGSDAPFVEPLSPNDTWCVDFKGHFLLGNGERCDPFTLTDQVSRYILKCEGLAHTGEPHVRPHLERAFREFGLPLRMRSDNGPPFATGGLGRLSSLSVWFMKLGIELERIDPGHPEQNGRHERMHRTLKTEVPPRQTFAEEQLALDRFRFVFNEVRPHEALGQKTPAELYRRSSRELPARLVSPEYPARMHVRKLDRDGRMRWNGSGHILVASVLGHEPVGLDEIADNVWRLYFGTVVLADVVCDSDGTRLEKPRRREVAQVA